ncbi:hypothetical protein [Chitinophaga defluvii]|uniref:Oxygen tolerance protein BatD n=1 Tax=Chitinophaga defluvii TaxID=3163343 RepID=A0ABV2TAQ2_9BACT
MARKCYPLLMILVVWMYAGKVSGQIPDLRRNLNYKGILHPNCDPMPLEISDQRYPFVINNAFFLMGLTKNYSIFKLDITKKATYAINVLCDSVPVNFLVVAADTMMIPEYGEKREYLSRLTAEMEDSKDYYLVLFKEEKNRSHVKADVSFCENEPGRVNYLQPTKITEETTRDLYLYDEKAVSYEGMKYAMFDISSLSDHNNYVRIRVSADFVPVIVGLNGKDQIIIRDKGLKDEYTSTLLVSKKDSIAKIGIKVYRDEKTKYENAQYKYNIRVETFPYNPDGKWWERIKWWFQDPLFTFLAALVVTAISVYVSYVISRKKKILHYRELVDSVIIFDDPADSGSTPITVENEVLHKACLFRMKLHNNSGSRIEKSYVKEKVTIELLNMVRIVTFKMTPAGNGWGTITKTGDNIITVDFDFIDDGDELEFKIIAEIDEHYFPKGGIHIKMRGKIAEVKIKEYVNTPQELFDSTFMGFGMFFYLMLIPLLLVSAFDLRLPSWGSTIMSFIYSVWGIFAVVYFTCFKRGRRIMMGMFHQFKYSLKRLLQRG